MNSVCLIEDDEKLRLSLADILREHNLWVDEYASVEVSLAHVYNRPPSLIICDLNLESLSGIDFLRILRANEALSKVPVIIITGDMNIENRKRCLEFGAVDYLIKPFLAFELLLKSRNLIRIAEKPSDFNEQINGNRLYQGFEKDYLKSKIEFYILNTQNDLMNYELLAKHLNMSRSSLQKKVRKYFNSTLSEFVHEAKLKKAKNLLESTDISVKTIFNLCGFNSQVYFNKVFKNFEGITPKAYRRLKNG